MEEKREELVHHSFGEKIGRQYGDEPKRGGRIHTRKPYKTHKRRESVNLKCGTCLLMCGGFYGIRKGVQVIL